MSNKRTSLAARRAQLIEQCQAQRGYLAEEILALRAPFSFQALRARLGAPNKLVLAAAGITLGLVAMRPRRVTRLAARGLALVGAARRLLPLLQR